MTVYELKPQFNKLKRGNLIVTFPDGRTLDFVENGMYISTQPIIPVKRRKIDAYFFKGQDGFYPIDNETYRDIEFPVEISVICKNEEEREYKKLLLESLQNGQEMEFLFYHDPYGRYRGIIEEWELQGNASQGYSLTGKLNFRVQPFRYPVDSINQTHILSKGDSFKFDVGQLNPVFEITGSGDITLTTDTTVTLKNIPSGTPIFVDSLTKRTYQKPTSNTLVKRGDLKSNYDYPILKSGTKISWTGNVTSMKVHLNWRI